MIIMNALKTPVIWNHHNASTDKNNLWNGPSSALVNNSSIPPEAAGVPPIQAISGRPQRLEAGQRAPDIEAAATTS